MKVSELDAILLDGSVKGIPGDVEPFPLSQIAAKRWNVLCEDLPLPLAVLRQSALRHNGHWMREFLALSGAVMIVMGGLISQVPLSARAKLLEAKR